ncbi:unnamed protein product, partial [Scytosiphon promiscuus]
GARQRGRPVGSKSRSSDEDPPYVVPNPLQQRPSSSGDDSSEPIAKSRPRRRTEPRKRWADQMMNPGEQWARKIPKSERPLPTNPVEASIPDAPTFYPTEEQFRDPLTYVESIRPLAESYGIAKIVPPEGWSPPPTPLTQHSRKLLPTKKQALHSLMNSDEVYDDGDNYTILEYKQMADRVAKKWRARDPPAQKPRAAPRYEPMGPGVEVRPGSSAAQREAAIEENGRLRLLEREYWNVVDGGVEEVEVEYANDLNISEFWSGFPMPPRTFMDGSSFDRTKPCDFEDPEYYRTCGWNLNNLPFWPGSVLRFFRTHINGLTAPWCELYLGMQYATFAWHNEDNYLYSLNYHHSGSAKQWYGVPGNYSKGFEKCLAKILGETMETVSEHLYRITKMLSPVYLQEAGVPVCRLQQHPGQFVVTFPKAYHGGFSYGFNCGEAVNFAVPDWIAYSRESTEAYRSASRMAALSHDKMVATLTMYLPDHDIKGCLVVSELRRIYKEEIEHRTSLEMRGVQDPARQGVPLPRFRLGLIERDTEEYDER